MSNSIISSALGQVGDLGKQTIKEVTKQQKKIVKSTLSQAGFERPEKIEGKEQVQKVIRNKDTEDFVKGLYGSEQIEVPQEGSKEQQVQAQQQAQPNAEKSPEEQAKLAQLRNKLHQETYYQPLITRPKKQEEVEKPKERVERLEMEELQQEEEKKKKKAAQDADISIEREKTKTEKRPGAG